MSSLLRQSSFLQPVINPFVYDLKLTFAQKLQVAVMSITIAPFRLLIFTIFYFIFWFWGLIVTIGMPICNEQPLGPIQKALCGSFRLIGRLLFIFLGFHSVEVKGKRASTVEAPILVCAPHSTMFDVLVSFATDPLPSSLSRLENYQTPFLGTFAKTVQPILVSRTDSNSRQKTIKEILRRIRMPGHWPQILIFPEGTCTNRKALITFKAGAFIPGAPVQPVLVEYLNGLDTVTWTMKGPGAFKLLWLCLCQIDIKVRVTYLPVYIPTKLEIEDPKLYAKNVRSVMAEALQIPSTEHTFEDCRLMRHAAALNLPMDAGLIEFSKLSRKLGISIDSAQERLSEFSKIARQRTDGMISIEDFSKFLNVPISPALQEMFNLYDRDQSGFIDFREYVIGLSLVSQPAVTEASVKLAFKIFDQDQNGMITEDEFSHVLHATFGEEIEPLQLFRDIKKSRSDKLTFDEFHSFVVNRPEYARLFVWFSGLGQDTFEAEFPGLNNMLFSKNAVIKSL